MGGVAAIVSALPAHERERRLRAMAEVSPYRGELRTWHFPGVSFGCQARNTDATWHETDACLVLAHGRPYAVDCEDPSPGDAQGASLVGRLWAKLGIHALARLDGEYALLIHDKQADASYACVSLMLTRQLYHARADLGGGAGLVLASEMRQVAAGAGLTLRLDYEQVVQSLCLNGPILDRRRTEYQGIDRLLAPICYRLDPRAASPRRVSTYWEPPEPEPLTPIERQHLPSRIIAALRAGLRAAPEASGLTLSGGYDSGTLWAVAYADRARRPMPQALSLSLPGMPGDETETVRELLRLTEQSARFVEVSRASEQANKFAEESGLSDRIPLAMGVAVAERFPRLMRATGLEGHIQGIGAEAGLTGYAYYIADALRRGRLIGALRDLLHLESYYRPSAGVRDRLRLLLSHGLAPEGSRLRRVLRPERPPVPLSADWLPLFAEASHSFVAGRSVHGFSRGVQLEELWHYTLITGIETHEQINERHGVELQMPFLHRRAMDIGLRLHPRDLACGTHEKALLRRSAAASLGCDPPWPRKKVIPGLVTTYAPDALMRLGPPGCWQLVQHGVLDTKGAARLWARARAGQALAGVCGRIVTFERFVRALEG